MGLPFHIPALLLGCALGDVGWTTYYLLGGERKYPILSPLAHYVCKKLDEMELRAKYNEMVQVYRD